MSNRKILLDVETTGFNYGKGDKIVELACVEIFDDKDMKGEFHVYINPQRNIPDEVIKIHGISNEQVKDAPIFEAIAEDFLKFVDDCEIIAHNSTFDMNFINAELKNISKDIINPNKFIDTLKLAQAKFPNQRNRLDDLCKRFDIDLETRKNYHGALIDTRLLGEVYIKLVGGQKSIFDNAFSSTESLASTKIASYDNSNFEYRSFVLSESEKENHIKFIEKINKSMWYK